VRSPGPVTAREIAARPRIPLRRIVLTWLTRLRLLRDQVQMLLPEQVATAAAWLPSCMRGWWPDTPTGSVCGPDAGSLTAAFGVDLRRLLLGTSAEPPWRHPDHSRQTRGTGQRPAMPASPVNLPRTTGGHVFGLRPGDRVLAVAAHPDDETLGAGGTIARLTSAGIAVDVLAVGFTTTSGPGGGGGSDPAVRQGEFDAACDVLGVGERGIAWVDDDCAGNPAAHLPELVALIESGPGPCLRTGRPQGLLIPAGGSHHQDHQAVHQAGRAAARPGAGGHLHAPRVVLGFQGPEDWAWACAAEGWPVVVDTTDVWAAKEKALGCYRSQLRQDPHPRSTGRIHALDVARGAGIGAGTAERFLPYRIAF